MKSQFAKKEQKQE